MLEGRKVYTGSLSLHLEGKKNVYVSMCACVYTTVCVDEGGL